MEEVGKITGQFESAAPLIEIMAGDPSIRGLTGALETGLAGVKRGQVKLDNTARPFNQIAQTVEDVLNKGTATFSWRQLVSDKPLTDSDRRAFIEFKPVLDFNALEPGKDATDAIRQAAADLDFPAQVSGARVRLTGPVPIANEEYATVQDGAVVNGIGTVLVVLFILWMALHSAKIIFAVFVNLFIGLSITTALGLMMVGSLNLLSIAFAVLFVGLGVDFGIQFSVRYRSERFKNDDLRAALAEAARRVGGAAVAGRDGDGGRIPVVPADRLQGHLRTRRDRRRRHAGRVHLQHHGAAGAAEAAQPARREGAGRLRVPGAGRPFPRKAPRRHHRRHACWSRSPACRCSIS